MAGADNKIEWIDSTGAATELGFEWNLSGRFAPPVDLFEDVVPGQPGAILREVRVRPKEFTIGFWIQAANDSALRVAVRSMVSKLDPSRGGGWVRVEGPDGQLRQIPCRVSKGLGLKEKVAEDSASTLQRIVATFRSWDPFWEDVTPVTPPPFDTGEVPNFFPWPPMLRLASSEIVADVEIDNTGDVSAYPVWTITGPGAGIVMINSTTGEFIDFGDVVLGAGETITINTRPSERAVLKNGTTNLFGSLRILSTLWTLRRGINQVQLQMNNSTASSSLALSYKRRYLSP